MKQSKGSIPVPAHICTDEITHGRCLGDLQEELYEAMSRVDEMEGRAIEAEDKLARALNDVEDYAAMLRSAKDELEDAKAINEQYELEMGEIRQRKRVHRRDADEQRKKKRRLRRELEALKSAKKGRGDDDGEK